MDNRKKGIAIFASGSGSNAESVINYFNTSSEAEIRCILSNKADAFVLNRADKFQIPAIVFNRDEFYNTNKILQFLNDYKIDIIVLAGFLWLVPEYLIKNYPNKIINIHPALLPKFGGKGMYGKHVHEAVIKNKEKQSGITVHLVNQHFDEGEILLQETCDIALQETPESLAKKIQKLEHYFFPRVIEKLIKNF